VHRSLKNTLTALCLGLFFLSLRGASAEPSLALQAAVTPFLYPPYPGSASQESIFDHSTPNYTYDNIVLAYTGDQARRNCPSPPPAGTPPPQAGVCNAGAGGYWSYSLGDWVYYDGHDGVDYGISYRPVYAAADADQIVYAGWWDPQNHRVNLGIYVRLRHPNGYHTYYGHMSSVAVQSCPTPGCTFVPHGEMLGISGTTGNSSGPHLHLLVRNPSNRSVDPYGWRGSGADPWVHNQRESLWVTYPSLAYYGARIYPSGPALEYPRPPLLGLIVDDGTPGFVESPDECWNDIASGSAQGGVMRFLRPRTTAPTCTAQWFFPRGSGAGTYAAYVRIPAIRATTEGAIYTIRHAGESEQVVVNQGVFPNIHYVTDGWLYIGKYDFTGEGEEYIELTNRTQDEAATVANLYVGVDAVRFVLQGAPTPTPGTPVTPTPSSTPSITTTPSITLTPSETPSPTLTRTVTPSRTPTVTRTATATRTASLTVTPSRTRTPTRTATATHTRFPTRTPTITRTPTVTRTPTRTRTATPSRTPTRTRTPTLTVTPSRTRTLTPTRTPSRTPTVTRTPTATRTRIPTATPQYRLIEVYFVNRFRYENNLPPFTVSGDRWARSNILPQTALNEYFKGPGSTERFSFGWIALYNGFTGYSRLEIRDGIAHVYLTGSCTPDGRDFNIADLILLNLKQFSEIQFVKIYDEKGATQDPDSSGDSIPACLQP
jgi:murein DD-endopeptidase MepM/ murein hydrolase activator NlpD